MPAIKGTRASTNKAGTVITGVTVVGLANPDQAAADQQAKIAKLTVRLFPVDSGDPALAAWTAVVSSSLPIVSRAFVEITGAGVGTISPTSSQVSPITTATESATGNNFGFTVQRPAAGSPPGGITVKAIAVGAYDGVANAEVPPVDLTTANVEAIAQPIAEDEAEIAAEAAIETTFPTIVNPTIVNPHAFWNQILVSGGDVAGTLNMIPSNTSGLSSAGPQCDVQFAIGFPSGCAVVVCARDAHAKEHDPYVAAADNGGFTLAFRNAVQWDGDPGFILVDWIAIGYT